MRTKMAMMIVLMIALVFGREALAQNQLQLEDVQSEIVGSPDSAGNVQFRVTATAFNPSEFGSEFSVEIRGLDESGSPVTSVYVQGRVDSKFRGALVGQGSMPSDQYSSIVNWVKGQ